MTRMIALFAVAMLLIGGAARGQDKFDPAVKKLMPKDQLELAEKMEALTEKHATLLFRIKDAGKRREVLANRRVGQAQLLGEGPRRCGAGALELLQ